MYSLETLINELLQPDAQRATQARKMLVASGKPAVEHLTAALPMISDQHRWKVILVLSEIGDASAAPTLIPFLNSPSPAIRAAAAQFLGNFGDERVVETLIAKLNEQPNTSACIWIIQALGKLKDTRAVDPLIQMVYLADSPSMRYTAIEALGKIGDPRAADTIRQFSEDSDHHVQARAQTALQRLYAQQS